MASITGDQWTSVYPANTFLLEEAWLCKQTELKIVVFKKYTCWKRRWEREGKIALTLLLCQYRRTPLIRILIGTASHMDNWTFFFENTPHWQFEVWLLLFTVCTCV
jgi:hypothetical protein